MKIYQHTKQTWILVRGIVYIYREKTKPQVTKARKKIVYVYVHIKSKDKHDAILSKNNSKKSHKSYKNPLM